MTKEKLVKAFQGQELPKLFEDSSVPSQKVSECGVRSQLAIETVPIKLEEIFAKGNKILITGEVGAGKSTTTAQLLNLWANNGFPQFEYAFDIKAKWLLSNWKSAYSAAEIRDTPLACFIHYSHSQLVSKADRLTLEEIITILKSPEQILLVVDGLDAVAHLMGSNGDQIINDIIYEATSLEHVVMTSRPNSLSPLTENIFDCRVEATGFGEKEIVSFIQGYYERQVIYLKDVIEEYFSANPTNTGKDLLKHLKATTDPLKLEALIQLKRIENFSNAGSLSTKDGTLSAVDSYYHETESLVIHSLQDPYIAKMATSPMNLAILCLIFSEPSVQLKVQSTAFTIDEIYKEVIILMGKKFEYKQGNDEQTGQRIRYSEITNEKVLHSKELEMLQEIAYEALKNGNQISGANIDGIIRAVMGKDSSYSIKKLYNFGALRTVSNVEGVVDSANLIAHDHVFNQLSFQTYFAACSLVKKLSSNKQKTYVETVDFIAKNPDNPESLMLKTYLEALEFIAGNRNDPKHLMLLKFIAGMLVKEDDANQIAITRFWEAVEVNIEGVLELGAERKVILLMHLLQQAKIHGKIDERIPNLKQAIDFVDQIVMENLERWKSEVLKSGYLSEAMKQKIWDIIDNQSKTSVEETKIGNRGPAPIVRSAAPLYNLSSSDSKEKSILEMSGNLLDKLDNHRLFKILLCNTDEFQQVHWSITETSINVLAKIIATRKFSISSDEMNDLVKNLVKLIENGDLKDSAANALKAIIEVYREPQIIDKILKELLALLEKEVSNDELLELIHIFMMKSEGVVLEKNLLELVGIINMGEQKDSIEPGTPLLRQSSLDASVESMISSHDNALKVIKGLIKAGKEGITNFVLDHLVSSLRGEAASPNIAFAIGEILVISGSEVQQTMYERLLNKLDMGGVNAVAVINSMIGVKAAIKSEFAEQILQKLHNLLVSNDIEDQSGIAISIGKIADVADEINVEIRKKILDSLTEIKTAEAYSAMAKVAKNGDEELISQVFNIFISVLRKGSEGSEVVIGPLDDLFSGAIGDSDNDIVFELISGTVNFKLLPIIAKMVSNASGVAAGQLIDYLFAALTLFENEYKKIMEAILVACGKDANRKMIALDKLIEILNSIEFATATEDDDKEKISNIVYIMSKISDVGDSQEALLEKYVGIMLNRACGDAILIDAIGAAASKLEVEKNVGFINTMLLPIIDSQDSSVSSMAIYSIGKVVSKITGLNSEMSSNLIDAMLVKLSSPATNLSAIYTINKILRSAESTYKVSENILPSLLSFLGDTPNAISAVIKIIGRGNVDDSELDQILSSFRELLRGDQLHRSDIHKIYDAIGVVADSMSLSKTISLLKDKDSEIRQIAVDKVLKKLDGEFSGSWEENVKIMFNIIGSDFETIDESVKKLNEAANKKIQSLVQSIDAEEQNLKYIVDNFNDLMALSPSAARAMMELVFYSVLSDNKITKIERDFIELCITKLKFTISVFIPPKVVAQEDDIIEFMIQYGNKIYRLQGEENREHVEHIANIALANSDDLLAKQYLEHKPIFHNSGSAIPRAATDVEKCPSFLTGENLKADKWEASWLYFSNDQQSYPEKAALVLLKREVGGYFSGHKISVKNGKISASKFKEHPDKLTGEFYEGIVGDMKHDSEYRLKARIYSKTFSLDIEKGQELISIANSGGDQPTREIVPAQSHFQLSNLRFSTHHRPSSPHKRSTKGDAANPKVDIKALYQFIQQYVDLKSQGITSTWKIDQNTFAEHGRELVGSRDHADSMQIDLQKVSDQVKMDEKAQGELLEIGKNIVHKAFYFEITAMLNSVYAAALSIKSQMVENKQQGVVGNVGSIISTLSSHVPVVGAVAHLFGELLRGVDNWQQEQIIERIVSFGGGNPVKMAAIVDRVARKLALILDSLDVKEMSNFLGDLAEVVNNTLQGGVAGIAKNIVSVGMDVLEGSGNEESHKEKEGKKIADIIGKLIIKNMSTGNYKKDYLLYRDGPKVIANLVIKDVSKLYTLDQKISGDEGHTRRDSVDADPHVDLGSTGGVSIGGDDERKSDEEITSDMVHLQINADNTDPTKASNPVDNSNDEPKDIKPVKNVGCTGGKCVVSHVQLDGHPILSDPEFQAILKLPNGERGKAGREYMAKKFPAEEAENFLLKEAAGRELLEKALMLYGEEAYQQLLSLGKDKEFVEQALEVKDSEEILDILFGDTLKTAMENFEALSGSVAQNGFAAYIDSALYGVDAFAKKAKQLIKHVNYFSKMLENALNMGESGNKIAILSSLIEFMMDHAALGETNLRMVGGYRPSGPGGDDGDFGGGFGGAGQYYENNNGNQTQAVMQVYPVVATINVTGIVEYLQNNIE